LEDKNLTSSGWPAPAKLNLFLHVVGRRPDGYHLLQTAFQFVDYHDSINFTIRKDSGLTLTSGYPGINENNNLVMRAARLLQHETGCTLGAEIAVIKSIPVGGGLGGGSSNAATTLVALNRLWSLELTVQQLASLGLTLGADIPVFVHGQAAWAEGIGEELTPFEPVENWNLIIYPGCQVPTADVFNDGDLTRNTPAITIRDFLRSGGHNDCEAVVRHQYPPIAAALDWLRQYGNARMTGTGSCVFASFNDRDQAVEIYNLLPSGWQGFVARGLNRSPLIERLMLENK
jgi:4-diphosphocytidyl-2-C-methyl-D-erythritol kinase